MNLVVKSGRGALVFVLGNKAYKWFLGTGASEMLLRERKGQELVVQCSAWASHALRAHFCNCRVAVTSAGESVDAVDCTTLGVFISARVKAALDYGTMRPADELIPLEALRAALGESGQLVTYVHSIVNRFNLPSGPTHGDLHRGNLLHLSGEFRVIDFDRFRLIGCPLFDLLHFHLSEVQRHNDMPWLDILSDRPDIVQRATLGLTSPHQLYVCYAIQRIAHEGQSALIRCKSLKKYTLQTERVLSYHTEHWAKESAA